MKTAFTKTTPSAEEVVRYLKHNPSFFEDHEDLLADMIFGQGPNITPFYERQLTVLKDRAQQQSVKIDMIVDGAKHNQKLESELMEMTIRLLSTGQNTSSPIETVATLMKRQFDVAAASIFIAVNEGEPGYEQYHELSQRVIHKSSVCDDRVSTGLLESLFGNDYNAVASCAFVPLIFDNTLLGVMVLGSNSMKRFKPGVGVIFLDRLGLIIGSYLHGNK